MAGSAGALESEGFTITDEQMSAEKDFPPIPLQNPTGTLIDPTLDDCKSLPSDHAVKISIMVRSTVPARFGFEVSWPAAEANDLDVYFFQDDGELVATAASIDHPEEFNLAGLPNGDYWMCVRNYSGVNAGFTISAEASFVDLYQRPPMDPTPTPERSGPAKQDPGATAPPPPVSTDPSMTPETIATPGPDGDSRSQALVSVAGDRQAAEPAGGRGALQVSLLVLTGVIVAGGVGLVALRIRRDLTP